MAPEFHVRIAAQLYSQKSQRVEKILGKLFPLKTHSLYPNPTRRNFPENSGDKIISLTFLSSYLDMDFKKIPPSCVNFPTLNVALTPVLNNDALPSLNCRLLIGRSRIVSRR